MRRTTTQNGNLPFVVATINKRSGEDESLNIIVVVSGDGNVFTDFLLSFLKRDLPLFFYRFFLLLFIYLSLTHVSVCILVHFSSVYFFFLPPRETSRLLFP